MATMDAAELRAALDKLGLKQTGDDGLTAFLDVGDTTVRRWVRDAAAIPESVAMLLRLMIGLRLKPANTVVRYGRRRGQVDSRDAPDSPDSRESRRRA